MKKKRNALVVSARDDSEIVWLKDVTTSFEKDKRTSIDLDLPDELTFYLSRGSNDLTLHLKRNYFIDPNADVYVVQKLENGKHHLEKTENLGNEVGA
ncbi:hypothetical protein CHS0354_016039 [Potamilus streckersoni]|uniref:Uncharacterized protein n=1 Tax=Potamilus streckersoni TaxID=2493646 RepID=A0AAE0RQD2_9BIVA|nr:hypothetical protein CHS0354_016039 [Potamilus streckersoni]